jgi:hypothetical protein
VFVRQFRGAREVSASKQSEMRVKPDNEASKEKLWKTQIEVPLALRLQLFGSFT